MAKFKDLLDDHTKASLASLKYHLEFHTDVTPVNLKRTTQSEEQTEDAED